VISWKNLTPAILCGDCIREPDKQGDGYQRIHQLAQNSKLHGQEKNEIITIIWNCSIVAYN